MYSKVLFNILATLSGIYSGILSGIYYDILSGTHSGILSSIYYPDVLFAILLASILTFYLAFFDGKYFDTVWGHRVSVPAQTELSLQALGSCVP